MRVLYFAAMLILILSPAYVLAVGGGGGGGGDGGSGGGSSGGGVLFSPVKCYDDGSIELQMYEEQKILASKKDSEETFEVMGIWSSEGNFRSNEAVFRQQGRYKITNNIGIEKLFTCPGLVFACSEVGILNTRCIKNHSGLFAEFELNNDSEKDNLKFNYILSNKVLSSETGSYSPQLKNLSISQNGRNFLLSIRDNIDAKEFEVVHKKCIGKRYIYSRVSCTEEENISGDEIKPEQLKCGGLSDIKDRVRCRINLESEHDEYENFYPEECRNHNNPTKCFDIYKTVSSCWDLTYSRDRVSCLQNKINLNRIEEKDRCKDSECRKNLNEKLLTMVKLRFYNLEEQAEILSERGLLEEEDLIDFVVKIELKKQEFNSVKSKEEMKRIILEARALWQELTHKLKNE